MLSSIISNIDELILSCDFTTLLSLYFVDRTIRTNINRTKFNHCSKKLSFIDMIDKCEFDLDYKDMANYLNDVMIRRFPTDKITCGLIINIDDLYINNFVLKILSYNNIENLYG